MRTHCPIAVELLHPEGAHTCPRCIKSVTRRIEWLAEHDSENVRLGAWFANDAVDWAARAVRNEGAAS